MYKKVIKRILDIILSFLFLIPITPIIFIFALIIYLSDFNNPFYNSYRVGKNGKNFKMFKLRTMKFNAPDLRNEDGSTYNSDEDFRLTKVGKIIRKTSIDELPQLLNVLLGSMSLIGPRPNLVTKPFDQLTLAEQKRLAVSPGITGYNQAYFRNSVSTETKFKNDVFYVDNVSFLMDVKIFVKTIFTVIQGSNIYNK
ncbi:sugar transferase [Streptococcus uberis]